MRCYSLMKKGGDTRHICNSVNLKNTPIKYSKARHMK